MAIVCDGVGGLARGNVASATVVDRFDDWFVNELPALMEGMIQQGSFQMPTVKAIWGALLAQLNEMIQAYGTKEGSKLGTTFTGLIACDDRYLVAHVGDCRAYRMSAAGFEQLTEDQTLINKQLAAGEITEEEAAARPQNVILQSVGTERVLKPEFYEGSFGADDLFVICCDGAYKRAGNEGVRQTFQAIDYRNEEVLTLACDELMRKDMEHGEKDNLTVVCLSGALAGPDGSVAAPQTAPTTYATVTGGTPTGEAWTDAEEDAEELVTAVYDDEGEQEEPAAAAPSAAAEGDDTPTTVESIGVAEAFAQAADEGDDTPTTVESVGVAKAFDEGDDSPTTVESIGVAEAFVQSSDEGDDTPTTVEHVGVAEAFLEPVDEGDDSPTTVEGIGVAEAFAEVDDEGDDSPTTVESIGVAEAFAESADEGDDSPTTVESVAEVSVLSEDDLEGDDSPTTVESLGVAEAFAEPADEGDDSPTTVESLGVAEADLHTTVTAQLGDSTPTPVKKPVAAPTVGLTPVTEDYVPTKVAGMMDEDGIRTVVDESADDLPTPPSQPATGATSGKLADNPVVTAPSQDDLHTVVEQFEEDNLQTVVDHDLDADDVPTTMEQSADEQGIQTFDSEDIPTAVDYLTEDDRHTVVFDQPLDEDDVPTVIDGKFALGAQPAKAEGRDA